MTKPIIYHIFSFLYFIYTFEIFIEHLLRSSQDSIDSVIPGKLLLKGFWIPDIILSKPLYDLLNMTIDEL